MPLLTGGQKEFPACGAIKAVWRFTARQLPNWIIRKEGRRYEIFYVGRQFLDLRTSLFPHVDRFFILSWTSDLSTTSASTTTTSSGQNVADERAEGLVAVRMSPVSHIILKKSIQRPLHSKHMKTSLLLACDLACSLWHSLLRSLLRSVWHSLWNMSQAMSHAI